MKKPRNPVALADSIDALDLISYCLRFLRLQLPAPPAFLERLREQRLRHIRALRFTISEEHV